MRLTCRCEAVRSRMAAGSTLEPVIPTWSTLPRRRYARHPGGGSGTITDTSDGIVQRIDGLAMSGGVSYGSYAGGNAEDGLWTINPATLDATPVIPVELLDEVRSAG